MVARLTFKDILTAVEEPSKIVVALGILAGLAQNITLPAASATSIGRCYEIWKTDSSVNAVTVYPAGSDTFNANSTTNTIIQSTFITVRGLGATTWIAK